VLIVRAALAVAMLVFCVSALSQESGKRQAVAKEDKKTEQPKPATSIDTSSLEKAIRESIKEASEKPDADADKKLEIERKLAEYTGQLAVYTKELSQYTSDVSLFTLLLVFATAILGAIGSWQGYLALRSVRVAESALTDLERPYLFLDLSEEVFPKPDIMTSGRRRYRFSSNDVPVIYYIYNTGRTAAILTHRVHRIVDANSEEMPSPINSDVERGEVLPSALAIDKRCPFSVDWVRKGDSLSGVFLIGFIRYKDVFDRRHITGFCAKFDERTNRFALHGGDGYNYTRDETDETPS
jgi:hypothetical protein